jgi:hypothetical protein
MKASSITRVFAATASSGCSTMSVAQSPVRRIATEPSRLPSSANCTARCPTSRASRASTSETQPRKLRCR